MSPVLHNAARVLIVDDEPRMRELTATLVESYGHHPICAEGVDDALVALASGEIDLVITDLDMPGLGGLVLLAALSSRRTPPAVVVSGTSDLELIRTARLLGARAVLGKPFDIDLLEHEVGEALRSPLALARVA